MISPRRCRARRRSRSRVCSRAWPSRTSSYRARALQLHLLLTAEHALQLFLARLILHGPPLVAIAELRRRMEGPVRIGEMRPRQRAEIRPTGCDDRVHLIGLRDVADGDRRYVAF